MNTYLVINTWVAAGYHVLYSNIKYYLVRGWDVDHATKRYLEWADQNKISFDRIELKYIANGILFDDTVIPLPV